MQRTARKKLQGACRRIAKKQNFFRYIKPAIKYTNVFSKKDLFYKGLRE